MMGVELFHSQTRGPFDHRHRQGTGTMIEFEPQDGVRFIKNVMIEMEDGVRVALDMHVPDDGAGDWRVQAQPLLLEYIP